MARFLPCSPLPAQGAAEELVQKSPQEVVPLAAVFALAGVLKASPQFDGVVVLLTPTSLWAHISAGEVVSVMQAATLHLAEVLALREGAEFDAAVSETLSRPERLARLLTRPEAALGALVGAELAAARAWWLGQRVLLLGPKAETYARALKAQGAEAICGDLAAARKAGTPAS